MPTPVGARLASNLKRQLPGQKIAEYLNTHYVNTAIDVEKGNGVRFAEKYRVESYPTLLLIDENGKGIRRIEGFVDAAQLAEKLHIK